MKQRDTKQSVIKYSDEAGPLYGGLFILSVLRSNLVCDNRQRGNSFMNFLTS